MRSRHQASVHAALLPSRAGEGGIMGWTRLFFGIVVVFLAVSAPARAGGLVYDCDTAVTPLDKLICNDDDLAFLNLTMKENYEAAIASLDVATQNDKRLKALEAQQKAWKEKSGACAKAADVKGCVLDVYHTRIAELQARYLLIKGGEPRFFECNDDPENDVVATFFNGAKPAVRLERGEKVAVGTVTPSSDGAKYTGNDGVVFWVKGKRAKLDWPPAKSLTCVLKN
jgi:uncharacterized protein